jgi:hypothetical protein
MDLQVFRSLFQDSIRARLDWELLASSRAQVHMSTATGRDALGALSTVWYTDAAGGEGRFDDPGSRMLTVAEAAASPAAFPVDRLLAVSAIGDSLQAQHRPGEPVLLTLPCYWLGGTRLLLDVTHRAVATYLSGLDVRLLLLDLAGPINSDVLPDLGRVGASDR